MNSRLEPMVEPNWSLGREIRDFIRSSSGSADYPSTWGACLRVAVRRFHENKLSHGLLAVGRLRLQSGAVVDHAWLLDRVRGSSITIDPANPHPGTSYSPWRSSMES